VKASRRGKMPTHLEKQQALEQTNATAREAIALEARRRDEKNKRLRELRQAVKDDSGDVSA